jgi:hypothetical protein
MWAARDIAEWWDEQHRSSNKALDEFVDEHPNWIGVFVAGTTGTFMDLGAGLVDVLRLGEARPKVASKALLRTGFGFCSSRRQREN